jgi:hypothetical protein
MTCETCQARLATVHIEGTKKSTSSDGSETIEAFEHHFCSDCADEYRRQEQARLVRLGSRTEKLRVLSVFSDLTVLRVVRNDPNASAEEWTVLTSRMPSQFPAGTEVVVTFDDLELEWLKVNRDSI